MHVLLDDTCPAARVVDADLERFACAQARETMAGRAPRPRRRLLDGCAAVDRSCLPHLLLLLVIFLASHRHCPPQADEALQDQHDRPWPTGSSASRWRDPTDRNIDDHGAISTIGTGLFSAVGQPHRDRVVVERDHEGEQRAGRDARARSAARSCARTFSTGRRRACAPRPRGRSRPAAGWPTTVADDIGQVTSVWPISRFSEACRTR